jgi:hypothetical protein
MFEVFNRRFNYSMNIFFCGLFLGESDEQIEISIYQLVNELKFIEIMTLEEPIQKLPPILV